MHDAYLQTLGAKYASFAPLYTENDHFAKTGSGQTQEKVETKGGFHRPIEIRQDAPHAHCYHPLGESGFGALSQRCAAST